MNFRIVFFVLGTLSVILALAELSVNKTDSAIQHLQNGLLLLILGRMK